jgi:hypothetical protein
MPHSVALFPVVVKAGLANWLAMRHSVKRFAVAEKAWLVNRLAMQRLVAIPFGFVVKVLAANRLAMRRSVRRVVVVAEMGWAVSQSAMRHFAVHRATVARMVGVGLAAVWLIWDQPLAS